MPRFDPFGKPVAEIHPSDLASLKHVSEGWYVEYKESVPTAKAIAKSIAAFANHYGGWLFYGIAQSRDGSNTAASFPGIPDDDLDSLQRRICDAAATSINPAPFFEMRILRGPEDSLALAKGCSVIMVVVPMGSDTPYVHASGKIYRRVADKSDPAAETDRAVLDLLWSRRREAIRRLARVTRITPKLSRDEESTSVLTLFLLTDLLGDRQLSSKIRLQQFADIMRSGKGQEIDFSCDNIFSSPEGYLARQVGHNDPYLLALTWRHFLDGASLVHLPIRCIELQHADSENSQLNAYKYWTQYAQALTHDGYRRATVVDLNLLLALVGAIVGKQQKLMEAGQVRGPLYAKVRVTGAWRRIPFVDSEAYLRYIASNRAPIIQDDQIVVPSGSGPASFVEIRESDLAADGGLLRCSAPIWSLVLFAFGLQGILDGEKDIRELLEATKRGAISHSGTAQ